MSELDEYQERRIGKLESNLQVAIKDYDNNKISSFTLFCKAIECQDIKNNENFRLYVLNPINNTICTIEELNYIFYAVMNISRISLGVQLVTDSWNSNIGYKYNRSKGISSNDSIIIEGSNLVVNQAYNLLENAPKNISGRVCHVIGKYALEHYSRDALTNYVRRTDELSLSSNSDEFNLFNQSRSNSAELISTIPPSDFVTEPFRNTDPMLFNSTSTSNYRDNINENIPEIPNAKQIYIPRPPPPEPGTGITIGDVCGAVGFIIKIVIPL